MTYSQCLYTTLDSSVLKSAAYSTDETLQLEFRTGPVYRYFRVPPTIFQNLMTATSKVPTTIGTSEKAFLTSASPEAALVHPEPRGAVSP